MIRKYLPQINFYVGNPPVLLLPDNIRIRRFNLSSEQYSDYVDNAEHIHALDYLWDPEGEGLSKSVFIQHGSPASVLVHHRPSTLTPEEVLEHQTDTEHSLPRAEVGCLCF